VSFELFALFLTATATFAFVPGPAIVYVMAATLSGGRAAGLRATAGLHLGGYVHVVSAVAGLAVLLEAVPTLYAVLKLVGAGYLIWLGIGVLRSASQGADLRLPARPVVTFRKSIIVEALNPKAALFYLAFLPQFTTPDAALSLPLQLLLLGVFVNAVFSLADVLYVLATDGLHRKLATSRAVVWVRRMSGALLVGLGCNLALSRT